MLCMIKAQYNCKSYGIIIILIKLLQKRETMLSQTTFFTPLYDTGFKSYQCNKCNKTFAHRNNLSSHILVKHNIGEKNFQCSECDRTFVIGGKLDQHVKRLRPISKKKPFMCEQCKMGFTIECELKRHIDIHSRIRTFQCGHCIVTRFFYVIMNLLAI